MTHLELLEATKIHFKKKCKISHHSNFGKKTVVSLRGDGVVTSFVVVYMRNYVDFVNNYKMTS